MYRYNFQPVYTFESIPGFRLIVYGDYKCWDPVPEKVSQLLQIGKPDILLYDPSADKILLGVEETAAVPTGNQSLQRLERVWFAAESRIPFVYLIGEYGLHPDGGVRRSSIWPVYLALKLSSQHRVPSVTLFYGSAEQPEQYSVGSGLEQLSKLASIYIQEWLGDTKTDEKAEMLRSIFLRMTQFVRSQYKEIADLLPGRDSLTSREMIDFMVQRVCA